MSLGVGKEHYKNFFQGNDSIMRLNYYPPCKKPDLTLGTGPHCDPTSLTILHQDQVSGLQVFVNNEWHSITPNSEAFVVNIGDTFMVIIYNSIYRSIYFYDIHSFIGYDLSFFRLCQMVNTGVAYIER